LFNPEGVKNGDSTPNRPKAAEVLFAIKSGTATVELLQGEIDRINSREDRSLELDREKVQALVQERFTGRISNLTGKLKMQKPLKINDLKGFFYARDWIL
jgi:hypothetical protein